MQQILLPEQVNEISSCDSGRFVVFVEYNGMPSDYGASVLKRQQPKRCHTLTNVFNADEYGLPLNLNELRTDTVADEYRNARWMGHFPDSQRYYSLLIMWVELCETVNLAVRYMFAVY